jgi:hypothetical protein
MGTLNIEPSEEKTTADRNMEELEASMAFEKAISKGKEKPAQKEEAVKKTPQSPLVISYDGLIDKTQTNEPKEKESKKDAKDIKSRLSFLSNMYTTDKSKQGDEYEEEPMENE